MTEMMCPRCNDTYLHHKAVRVYDRTEDSPTSTLTIVKDGTVQQKMVSSASNPSSRRDAVVIEFWCENCDDDVEMIIAQHKGQTFCAWREDIFSPFLRGAIP